MNRALKFVADSYGGQVPEMEVTDDDKVLFAQITVELKAYIENLEVVSQTASGDNCLYVYL